MSQQLRKLGCVVHTADHGQDCLDFLQTTVFASNSKNIPLSIILMDLEVCSSIATYANSKLNTDCSTDASNGRSNLRTKNPRVRGYGPSHWPCSRHRHYRECAKRADQYCYGGWHGHCRDQTVQDPRLGAQDAVAVV